MKLYDLAAELRFVQLCQVLGRLHRTSDPYGRRAAYARAGLGIVSEADDHEAVARFRRGRELLAVASSIHLLQRAAA